MKAGYDELAGMLKPLLESRFQLKFHHETKELPIYSLEVTQRGKLTQAEGECGPASGGLPDTAKLPRGPCGSLFILPGHVMGQKAPGGAPGGAWNGPRSGVYARSTL